MIELTWHVEKRNLKDLIPWSKNPRKISDAHLDRLENRIKMRGFHDILKVDTNNIVLSGNQRLKILQKLGYKEVDCRIPNRELTEEEMDKVGLESNFSDGENDYELLSDFDIDLLKDVGFENLSFLDAEVDPEQDEAPELDKNEIITQLGDFWELGNHRVLCGDCRNVDSVDALFFGVKATMILTDPPYGVDYASKNDFLNSLDEGNRNQIPIQNDSIDDYRQFFSEFLSVIPVTDYNTYYVFMSSQELHNLRLAFDDCGLKWGDYLVWVKNNHVLGRKDYNSRHEFCVYGWKGKHKFYGDFSTTILEFDKPLKNDLHPTMKPIELLIKLIKDGSQQNDIIYDAFLGSGSTLIACEQSNRVCYGCEIASHYVDVIVRRYINYKIKHNQRIDIKRNGDVIDHEIFL
jgi:DNA modification methylase